MSLINKMLQDLDARGGGARGAVTGGDVRPVAPERSARTAIAVGAGIGALILAAAWAGWFYLNRPPAAAVTPVAPAPAAVSAPRAAAPAAAPAVPAPVPAPVAAMPAAPEPPEAPPVAAEPAPPVAPPVVAAERKPAAPRKSAAMLRATAAVPEAPAGQGVTTTPQQRAENAYRRALAALQDGHVQDAVAALEQAVLAEPRHEAARQTLVGLLIESGRADEAIRHAALGLTLNANQPQLAMLLARLQLEHGGPAVETLQRTLPHALGNADYVAFLAGVLQKQQRHREAAEQYEAALRLQPQRGVWWMGLGLARQAGKLPEARDAYLKAKAAGLSPELQEFVDRKLAQLP